MFYYHYRLDEGASGAQPHSGFIEVFGEAPLGDGYGALAGAGEDAAGVTG
jgi:hypothetical protein